MGVFEPNLPLAVAYSGGADSTALLVCAAQKWPQQVVAVHVNHGLQKASDSFVQHCQAMCAQLQVPLIVKHVDAGHAPGQSPEDAARRARYEAFSTLSHIKHAHAVIQSIAIAQHADDQIETLLLALSRGAGLAGLSGMPAHWLRDGLHYHRPLLTVSASDIRCWLAQRSIAFIEDPTNQDERFTRNHIRARIMPVMHATFPHFLDTFARSASHAAQAQSALDEVALQDLGCVCGADDGLLHIQPLKQLSRARQANLLRYWLKCSHQVVPSAAQMRELLDQVQACTTRGHGINIKVGQGYVLRKGIALGWYNP